MRLIHKPTGEIHQAIIELVEEEDWKIIKENEYFNFKWIVEKEEIVHKIRLELGEEILGLISFRDIPKEYRINIRLIEVNALDRGKTKRFDNIAGCLFAFTCRLAFHKGYEGYVSLLPKTELIKHYRDKYGFQELGKNMYIELSNAERLVQTYLEDE